MGATEITTKKGDITTMAVDVIVNAANRSLRGGGGVDGAIHRAAGLELAEECKTLGGCMEGEAKITKGYNLPAKWIIHTVGPIYGRENGQEAKLLADCYLNSLKLAHSKGLKNIAFPAISTGAFGYPPEEAAEVVARAILAFRKNHGEIFSAFDKIIFVFLEKEQHRVFATVFDRIFSEELNLLSL